MLNMYPMVDCKADTITLKFLYATRFTNSKAREGEDISKIFTRMKKKIKEHIWPSRELITYYDSLCLGELKKMYSMTRYINSEYTS